VKHKLNFTIHNARSTQSSVDQYRKISCVIFQIDSQIQLQESKAKISHQCSFTAFLDLQSLFSYSLRKEMAMHACMLACLLASLTECKGQMQAKRIAPDSSCQQPALSLPNPSQSSDLAPATNLIRSIKDPQLLPRQNHEEPYWHLST
jgi:hypothetical protein